MRPDVPTLTLPTEKDDTDLVVCLHEGRKRGYTEFILAGAIGGRFDHTLSCLQCAADCALRGERAWLVDGQNRATILAPGTHHLPKMPGRKLSLLAYSPEVRDVTLTGAKWTLTCQLWRRMLFRQASKYLAPFQTGIMTLMKGRCSMVFTSYGGKGSARRAEQGR